MIIMIQLHVAEASPEGMYKVVQIIVCVFERVEVGLCKSRDGTRVQHADHLLNTGGKENGAGGGKKRYIYFSFCDLNHILHFVG
jgi:hypothetical protein